MDARLRQDVATSLDASPALLPFLPALLADVEALGSSPGAVIDLLRGRGLPAETTRVLDLGCGKGAVAVPLAEALGFQVLGVDAFAPFVEAARQRAQARGVAHRCRFVCEDLRRTLRADAAFDVLVYASIGPLLWPMDEAMRRLRRVVRPGGLLVIDDGFMAEEGASVPGYEGYAGHTETRRRLTAAGDEILEEVLCSPEAMHAENRRTTERIRRRAEELARAHPEQARLFRAYVRRQERECAVLEAAYVPALWLLRRS